MESKIVRVAAVRQALARTSRTPHPAPELQLLTQYVLGHLTLEQTNEQLRVLGLTLRLARLSPQAA